MKTPVNKEIIVAGDVHGRWDQLNILVNERRPKIILQAGDFGWWPKWHCMSTRDVYGRKKRWDAFGVKAQDTKIYFAPGNHEDWEDLLSRKNGPPQAHEIMPNVFYMERGATLTLEDGRTVLFMGGADSIDKDLRTAGHDWFASELIQQHDIYELPEVKVDIVISHTAPLEFNRLIESKAGNPDIGWAGKFRDPSQDALSYILNKYRPSLWYFGHFHMQFMAQHQDLRFYCLNMCPRVNWWRYLDV